MFSLSVLALLCLHSVALVNAALYILNPFNGSTCLGGQSCAVSWEDDGEKPLLQTIGVSTVQLKVTLNTGEQRLVQTLSPVNVATTSSFSFTPSREEGSNSNRYYIAFTSTKVDVSEGTPYRGYSPYFQLLGMSGSFDSPVLAATSTVSIPQSIETPPSPKTSTITVGTLLLYSSLSTLPTPSVTSSTSGFSTSTTTTHTSSASLSMTSMPANSNGGSSHLPRRAPVLFLALFSSFFFS